MRDYKLYLDDILTAVNKVEKYLKGFSSSRLKSDDRTLDAVIRNLEVIGEAVDIEFYGIFSRINCPFSENKF